MDTSFASEVSVSSLLFNFPVEAVQRARDHGEQRNGGRGGCRRELLWFRCIDHRILVQVKVEQAMRSWAGWVLNGCALKSLVELAPLARRAAVFFS